MPDIDWRRKATAPQHNVGITTFLAAASARRGRTQSLQRLQAKGDKGKVSTVARQAHRSRRASLLTTIALQIYRHRRPQQDAGHQLETQATQCSFEQCEKHAAASARRENRGRDPTHLLAGHQKKTTSPQATDEMPQEGTSCSLRP